MLRAETVSAINHLSTFLSGRIGQTYHLCLNSDHSVSRSLECSAHVSRFVCLLAYVKVKILLNYFMLGEPSMAWESSVVRARREGYRSVKEKLYLSLSWVRI